MAHLDPFIGRTVAGKFKVEKRLGKGGMGAVYRAQHVETKGYVAIKLMSLEFAENEDAVKRFLIEAQNTHHLQHPNTVTVSDYGETDDGILYIVMEYVEGQDLKTLLKSEGALAPKRAIRIVRQILKSLGEAHEKRVVHRDIKPDNIMLINQFGEEDFVKVLDFGISRSLEGSGAHTVGALGTPTYMAPEQWRSAPIDGRCDLYAVGCVLYHMLCGRPPFLSDAPGVEKAMALLHAHTLQPAPDIAGFLSDDVPRGLCDVVMSLLAKDPAARPPNARAVLESLTAIRNTGTIDGIPAITPEQVAEFRSISHTANLSNIQSFGTHSYAGATYAGATQLTPRPGTIQFGAGAAAPNTQTGLPGADDASARRKGSLKWVAIATGLGVGIIGASIALGVTLSGKEESSEVHTETVSKKPKRPSRGARRVSPRVKVPGTLEKSGEAAGAGNLVKDEKLESLKSAPTAIMVEFNSTPEGAEIWTMRGDAKIVLGRTPTFWSAERVFEPSLKDANGMRIYFSKGGHYTAAKTITAKTGEVSVTLEKKGSRPVRKVRPAAKKPRRTLKKPAASPKPAAPKKKSIIRML